MYAKYSLEWLSILIKKVWTQLWNDDNHHNNWSFQSREASLNQISLKILNSKVDFLDG